MSTHKEKNKSQPQLSQKLYVRYMVSLRCKMIVKDQLDTLGVNYIISEHGAIHFPDGICSIERRKLKNNLRKSGLILLGETESILIERIINSIIEIVHNSERLPKISYNEIIHDNLGSSSESILKIFSEVEGVSVTQFIVLQKIERAKEFLVYENWSLKKISERLNYRNESYFIAQFKKVTGLHPSYYSEIKELRLKNSVSLA